MLFHIYARVSTVMLHAAGVGDAEGVRVARFPGLMDTEDRQPDRIPGKPRKTDLEIHITRSPSRVHARMGRIPAHLFRNTKSIVLSVGFHMGKLPSLSKLSTTDTMVPVNPVPRV